MIDVTGVVENFRKLVSEVAKRHFFLDQNWNCDEWDELSECLFYVFVISPLAISQSCKIERCYENWGKQRFGVELLAKPHADAIFIESTEKIGREQLMDNCFTFVEFGHPRMREDDLTRFQFVSGLGKNFERICVAAEDCTFHLRAS